MSQEYEKVFKAIEQLRNKFPQLPMPSFWNKHEMKRYYFNKKEGAQDYTFFIDFIDDGNLKLLQKNGALWHSSFPSKQDILEFLEQQESIKTRGRHER